MIGNATQATEVFSQAARSWEAAIQAGLRLQEESVKLATEVISDMGSPQKWQKKTQAVMEGVLTTSRKNIDEAVRVINENAQTSMELLQRALQFRPGDSAEAQTTTVELWETTMGLLRRNTEAVLRANGRVVEAWTDLAKRMNGDQIERMAQMAQRAAQAATSAAAGVAAGASA